MLCVAEHLTSSRASLIKKMTENGRFFLLSLCLHDDHDRKSRFPPLYSYSWAQVQRPLLRWIRHFPPAAPFACCCCRFSCCSRFCCSREFLIVRCVMRKYRTSWRFHTTDVCAHVSQDVTDVLCVCVLSACGGVSSSHDNE